MSYIREGATSQKGAHVQFRESDTSSLDIFHGIDHVRLVHSVFAHLAHSRRRRGPVGLCRSLSLYHHTAHHSAHRSRPAHQHQQPQLQLQATFITATYTSSQYEQPPPNMCARHRAPPKMDHITYLAHSLFSIFQIFFMGLELIALLGKVHRHALDLCFACNLHASSSLLPPQTPTNPIRISFTYHH